MSQFNKKTERLDISVDESARSIKILQKWNYIWKNQPTVSRWTFVQKRNFHDKVDKLIWGNWSGKYQIKVIGLSPFAIKNKNILFDLNFDIQWVLTNPHWIVNVNKIPKNGFLRSNVRWNAKEINLDTEDSVFKYKGSYNGKKHYQYPVVHEFGHAIGNVFSSHADEYESSSSFYLDKSSIMNIGNELRTRHIDFILQELNSMIPNTRFYVL